MGSSSFAGEDWGETLRRDPINSLLTDAIAQSGFSVTLADARLPDCPLIYVNDSFTRLTGYAREQVIGQNCRFLQGEDTDPDAISLIRDGIRHGIPISCLLLNYRLDGSRFWNRFQLSPVRDRDGTLTAFLGVQMDVTDEATYRNREAEQQRLALLGRQATDFVHELNNLLLPAMLHSEGLGDCLDPKDRTGQEHLERLQASLRMAGDLTGKVLGSARPAAAKSQALDLSLIVEQSVRQASAQLGADIELCFDNQLAGDGETFLAKIEPLELKQIIGNLFANAAFAIEGTGKVKVSLKPSHRKVFEETNGAWAELSIQDNGCGMDSATRARIFEPFFSTKPVGIGTGVGLSTVFSIVERWGGRLEVESEPGNGSQFRIGIPCACIPQDTKGEF